MSLIGVDHSKKIIDAATQALSEKGVAVISTITKPQDETILNVQGMGNLMKASVSIPVQEGEITDEELAQEVNDIMVSVEYQIRTGTGVWEEE